MIKNLKKLRNERGISQKQLGEYVGVSQQSINKYENYDIEPDIATLTRLAEFFGTSVDYLIGNTEIRRVIEHTTACELNCSEFTLITNYRRLSASEKQSIDLVIDNYISSTKK